MHDNDPEVLEKEKNRVLSRNVNDKTSAPHEHAPGWNESLASASEAFVKADKSEGTKDEMQATTVEYMRARRTEDGDGSSSTTAFYTRDEVSGPLSGAQGKEEVILSKGRVAEIQADAILKALMWEIMTPSEEAVKADRGEVLW
ncbi:hypothetical protein GALMADRAFT_247520 [Galerina marginata CBS 339.88]|uniref:Uncharacterized protein n=1 Tax=Galerina marginata (strain CBS 339.88) TaxID=685588 RepID=A0A067SZB3_GALM3|nr:hypothetical protein GALMADRAFT_247520 [Galerina marginata CBS 339.88]